jgi:polyisoprenoid-binding protein YceI
MMTLRAARALTIAVVLCTASFAAPASAADFTLDPAHSQANFTVVHLALSKVHGVVPMTAGTMQINADGMPTAAQASFDLTKVDSHDENRDRSVRNDIFDVTKYPTMSFVATKFDGTPKAFRMTGNLSIHGVTKPVTLACTDEATAVVRGKKHYAFSGSVTIDRRDWDMHFAKAVDGALFAANEVLIDLEVDAGEK